jgi:hypothetical protein
VGLVDSTGRRFTSRHGGGVGVGDLTDLAKKGELDAVSKDVFIEQS